MRKCNGDRTMQATEPPPALRLSDVGFVAHALGFPAAAGDFDRSASPTVCQKG